MRCSSTCIPRSASRSPSRSTTRCTSTARALVPTYEQHLGAHSPLLNYTWERTRAMLADAAAHDAGSPFDGVIMEYVNPRTGGPIMPTIGSHIQWLPPGL